MKFATKEQLEAHAAATKQGAVEGGLAAGFVALAGSLWAHRRFPGYQRLPLSLKAFSGVVLIAPAIAVQAERRGYAYDKSQWSGDGASVLDRREVEELKRWDGLTLSQKIGDWSLRHEYTLIFGSWAGSLAVAGGIISRNKYQTYPQKIVQARMWAQALTIGILIAAGALTARNRAAIANHPVVDHSWMDVLEEHEKTVEHLQKSTSRQIGRAHV